ncbi:MAG: capsid protein [Lactobacillus sp.]|nr:capsid protein [Lactobacillus sp.]
MATVNYAEQYQKAVQQAFYDGYLYTSPLWNSPSNSLIDFDGAKHIKLPRLTIEEGRRDRKRRTIEDIRANYTNDWDSYEITNERYWSTLVDPSDVDETNYVTTMANITRQFNIDEKMPEMDKFMFSKLFKEKEQLDSGKGITTDTLDEKNILTAFDNMMLDFDEARIPAQNRFLYVTPEVNAILKRAEVMNRELVLKDPNSVERRVYSLDSVTIVVIPSDLMHTAYDFTVGAKTIDDSKQIEMMLIYNGVQIAPEKYTFAGFDSPSAKSSGNWLYYEQSYNDVLLLNTKTAGIQFVIADKVAPQAPSNNSNDSQATTKAADADSDTKASSTKTASKSGK